MERNYVNEEENKNLEKVAFMVYQHQKLQIMRLLWFICSITNIRNSWKWYNCCMLGALLGLVFSQDQDFIKLTLKFWSVIMSMYIGMVVLLILNLPLIPYIARILAVPRNYLIPLILFFQ